MLGGWTLVEPQLNHSWTIDSFTLSSHLLLESRSKLRSLRLDLEGQLVTVSEAPALKQPASKMGGKPAISDFFRWPKMGKSPGNVNHGEFFHGLSQFRMMKHGIFWWKSGEFWTGERWDECEKRFFARFPESICYLIILPCQTYGCKWPMINGLNMVAPLEWFKASNQPGWIGPGYKPRMDRPGWFINKGFPPFKPTS